MTVNKRGLVGSFIVTFITTVAIVFILLFFILGSGVIKKIARAESGVAIYNESDVGIDNIFLYMDNYVERKEVLFEEEGGVVVKEVEVADE